MKEEMEMNIETSMDDLRAGIADAIAKQDSSKGELDRFADMIERNREALRTRMLKAESAYQMDRAALADEFRLRFRNLQHDLDQEMRNLDAAFETQRAIDSKLFEAIDRARIS